MRGVRHAVVLVLSTSHAVRLERLLAARGVGNKMIPVPRQLSSDCGVCLRVARADVPAVLEILAGAAMPVQGIVEI